MPIAKWFELQVILYFILLPIVPNIALGVRVAYADIVFILMLVTYVLIFGYRIKIPTVDLFYIYFLYLLWCLFSIFNSGLIEQSFIEFIIYLFTFMIFLLFTSIYFTDKDVVNRILDCFVIISFVHAVFGLILFILNLLSGEATRGLYYTFNNTGQAGVYYLFSFYIYTIKTVVNPIKNRNIHRLIFFIFIIAIILTFKRSAIISLILFLLITYIYFNKNRVMTLLYLMIYTSVFIILLCFLYNNFEVIRYIIERKFTLDGDINNNFIIDTISDGLKAFYDHPILGVGVGGVYKVYSEYEIHNGYLKILANTGLVGFFILTIFLSRLLYLTNIINVKDIKVIFFAIIFSLLIVSGYTYIFRKREFWILLSFLTYYSFVYRVNYRNFNEVK